MSTVVFDLRFGIEISALLVEDHPSVTRALELMINADSSMCVVGTAANFEIAVSGAKTLNPDVIVMDVMLPGASGVEAAQEIRGFNQVAKILFYSGYPDAAESALAVDEQGFLLKGSSTDLVVQGIKTVINGGVCIDEQSWRTLKPRVQRFSQRELSDLTQEEKKLARLVPLGLTAKDMGERLKLDVRRVESLRARLIKRLGTRNAIRLASKLAFYFPPDDVEG